ncbi:glutaredoxin family protein [Undibacterium sp. Ji49W]|uniref:glutaredoxin family protein n=1 Tax=Undibacterium sp. Ji49W TaxID=3413040 RepID=UPI003BEFB84B
MRSLLPDGEPGLHPLKRLFLLALVSGLTSVALAGTVYKSVSPDGRVVFSDQPPKEGRLEKVMQFKDQPSSEIPASSLSYIERLKKARSAPSPAAGKEPVLYSASWCGYCKQAKSYLSGKGISYREVDIDTSYGKTAFAEAGGGGGIPLMLAGNKRIQGFTAQAYDEFFASKD